MPWSLVKYIMRYFLSIRIVAFCIVLSCNDFIVWLAAHKTFAPLVFGISLNTGFGMYASFVLVCWTTCDDAKL